MKLKRDKAWGLVPLFNPQNLEGIMRTYVWWDYDVWGNEVDGWEVNDRSCSGCACDLRGDESDEEIILACELDPSEYEIDENCSDPDFSIEVVRKSDGKPLGQLVPEEFCVQY